MKKYLLFDLDGTLTDPKEGITASVQYALKAMGIEEPDLEKLTPFIGPPLKDSFMEFYHMDEEQAGQAVLKYRERFETKGLYENKLYDGIPQMLRPLKEKGMHLAVASSKPTVFVERILKHFHIDQYFEAVVGSELDGRRVNKDEVVQETLNRLFGEHPVEPDQVYMIGDRKFDIEGARALGIESVGVAYGYGGMEELKAAKADYIVRSVEELKKFLLRGTEEKTDEKSKRSVMLQRMWLMLYSFLMFILVRNVVQYALSLLFKYVGESFTGPVADFFVVKNADGALESFTGNAATIIAALSYVGSGLAIMGNAKLLLTKTAEDMRLAHLKPEPKKNYVLLGAAAVGAVIGFNLLFDVTGFISKSDAYQAVAAQQYSGDLWIHLICYGIITPIAEELLFRGIIYGYMRRFMNVRTALVISSALFGLYHMNPIQGVYGFLIGCLMAYAYEYFGSFYMPVSVHIISNVISSLLSYTAIALTGFVSWPVCILFLIVAAGSLYQLAKQKKVF
ncbi:MAG TPA: HAD hydrolase-like protein [Candidatus Acetatifactor stercoripullorum]|uniref:HAD hydrolase-like protein n=1 Tax=Candidatus Acetatifactor stercoripullorum TaxID=2838414 RepID=A0A9D1R1S2_9FIRM|nr:HAD hydrolase-like protein [Candidatus Acetatifactor stercoripullorum]